jgi:hypothetical protein
MIRLAVTAIAQPACLLRRSPWRDAIGDRIAREQNENDAPNSLSSIDFVREWLPERRLPRIRNCLTSPRDAVCEILR